MFWGFVEQSVGVKAAIGGVVRGCKAAKLQGCLEFGRSRKDL
jgi:hypothetical protein